jgi:hypothetical protein
MSSTALVEFLLRWAWTAKSALKTVEPTAL